MCEGLIPGRYEHPDNLIYTTENLFGVGEVLRFSVAFPFPHNETFIKMLVEFIIKVNIPKTRNIRSFACTK